MKETYKHSVVLETEEVTRKQILRSINSTIDFVLSQTKPEKVQQLSVVLDLNKKIVSGKALFEFYVSYDNFVDETAIKQEPLPVLTEKRKRGRPRKTPN